MTLVDLRNAFSLLVHYFRFYTNHQIEANSVQNAAQASCPIYLLWTRIQQVANLLSQRCHKSLHLVLRTFRHQFPIQLKLCWMGRKKPKLIHIIKVKTEWKISSLKAKVGISESWVPSTHKINDQIRKNKPSKYVDEILLVALVTDIGSSIFTPVTFCLLISFWNFLRLFLSSIGWLA